MRGDRLQQEERTGSTETLEEAEVIDVFTFRRARIPSPVWRECIKKIWEVDPLECPRCKAEMKIISFIHERAVIRKILKHLDLWEEKRSRPPPPVTLQISETALRYEPVDDGWPGHEDPVFES